MNFLINATRLLTVDCDTISVTTQNCISLKRLMNTSKLAVICFEFNRKVKKPNENHTKYSF